MIKKAEKGYFLTTLPNENEIYFKGNFLSMSL